MSKFLKLFAGAALLAAAVAVTPGTAQARWYGHHGWHHGGWGWAPGLGVGLALGSAWAWGGPYYAYAPGPYYGPGCGWVRVRTYYGWRRAWRCW